MHKLVYIGIARACPFTAIFAGFNRSATPGHLYPVYTIKLSRRAGSSRDALEMS